MNAEQAREMSNGQLDNTRILRAAVRLAALRGDRKVKVKCFGPVDTSSLTNDGYTCICTWGTSMMETVVSISWA